MTAKDALKFIKREFIGRFGWDAESCVEEPQTREAVKALEDVLLQLDEARQLLTEFVEGASAHDWLVKLDDVLERSAAFLNKEPKR
jgi:hypothetical protein